MTDNRTTELLQELRDLACDMHAAEIISHVYITHRGWVINSEWLDSWHEEFDRVMQAIADELNARAERTCEVVGSYYYDDYDQYEFEFSCGHSVNMYDKEPPNYCPNCGAKVVNHD